MFQTMIWASALPETRRAESTVWTQMIVLTKSLWPVKRLPWLRLVVDHDQIVLSQQLAKRVRSDEDEDALGDSARLVKGATGPV